MNGEYEEITCPACGCCGKFGDIQSAPVAGHPNVDFKYITCECGEDVEVFE